MKFWKLASAAILLVLSTSVNSATTTLWQFSSGNAIDRTNTWASFNALQGGIQYFDFDESNGSTGIWAAGTNTLTNNTGTYSHTFGGTITGLSSYGQNNAFVTLDNGELWQFSSGNAIDRTNTWASFNALQGGIQYFDFDESNGSTGTWAAGTNTLTNNTGTYSHTFGGTITGLSTYGQNNVFVTLGNGELWQFSSGNAIDRTNTWASFNALQGGIQYFDFDESNGSTGIWAAGTNTLTNNTGTYSHTFGGTITGLSSYGQSNAFVVVTTVPIPGAVWLFGSGLIGLVGIARRKKA